MAGSIINATETKYVFCSLNATQMTLNTTAGLLLVQGDLPALTSSIEIDYI